MKRDVFEPQHEAFRREVADFVAAEVVPHLERWEADRVVDRAWYRRAGAAGLLGLGLDEVHGGRGLRDFRYNAVVIEELCQVGAPSLVINLGGSTTSLPLTLARCAARSRSSGGCPVCAAVTSSVRSR